MRPVCGPVAVLAIVGGCGTAPGAPDAGSTPDAGAGTGGGCSVSFANAAGANAESLDAYEVQRRVGNPTGNYDSSSDQTDVGMIGPAGKTVTFTFTGPPTAGTTATTQSQASFIHGQKQWLSATGAPIRIAAVEGTAVRLLLEGVPLIARTQSGAAGTFEMTVDCTVEGFGGL